MSTDHKDQDGIPLLYSEDEAAAKLGVKPRTLAGYRRQGLLKGNYSRVGRNVWYTPEHIRGILAVFSPRKAA